MENVRSNRSEEWSITCSGQEFGFQCDRQTALNSYREELAFSNISATMTDAIRYLGTYAFKPIGYIDPLTVYYPDYNGACSNNDSSAVINSDVMCIYQGEDVLADGVAHELGHIANWRYIGVAYNTDCPNYHGWALPTTEKCATSEGWADFYSAVVYFTNSATSPRTQGWSIEGDTTAGNSGLNFCVATLNTYNYQIEGNVARFLWDEFDTTDLGSIEAGLDTHSYSYSQLRNVWVDFLDNCISNRCALESDSDGVNLFDYEFAAMSYGLLGFEDNISINCCEDQDTD